MNCWSFWQGKWKKRLNFFKRKRLHFFYFLSFSSSEVIQMINDNLYSDSFTLVMDSEISQVLGLFLQESGFPLVYFSSLSQLKEIKPNALLIVVFDITFYDFKMFSGFFIITQFTYTTSKLVRIWCFNTVNKPAF